MTSKERRPPVADRVARLPSGPRPEEEILRESGVVMEDGLLVYTGEVDQDPDEWLRALREERARHCL